MSDTDDERHRQPEGLHTSTVGALGPWDRLAPWLVVVLSMAWGCWNLKSELTPVPYLDDSSIHQQMVRFAAARIEAGHLPLTSWFPYLGLGSPQFLHYQSLPAMLTGLLGTAVGPDAAFRWSLYLLLALWPIVIYWSARLFGLSRWVAASAAAISPLLLSAAGIGYETKAYVWIGYGVWTQLWASWTLPLAWGFTYRALSDRRAALPAVVFIALTMAMHFETGYLAVVPVLVWPFLEPSKLRARLGRAVMVGVAALLVAAWVTLPVILQSHWAAKNQILGGTGLENGYGARQVLSWLFSGQLYDAGRFPVVTILVGVGLCFCVARWKTSRAGRSLVVIWVVTLLMTFGRTTFGSVYSLLPGSSDIFIRRFQMGVQLSGILLAGVGIVGLGQLARTVLRLRAPRAREWLSAAPKGRFVLSLSCVVILLLVLTPALIQIRQYDGQNAQAIKDQASEDNSQAPQIDQLLSYVRSHGDGRVYAGSPNNWGNEFLVGAVPVYKYLESQDIDEVGYTLRTASLMTDPEFYFDQDNPGDYPLFGIRYLLLPIHQHPAVPARLNFCRGVYCLWTLPTTGYVHVMDTTGVLEATRADVGSRSVLLLNSPLLSEGRDLTVAFNRRPAARPTAPDPSTLRGPPGHVTSERDDLVDGQVRATVVARRRCVVVLSASFDPGWTATVNGRPVATQMVAPALVAVPVGPGSQRIVFRYQGFGAYDELWALALVVLVALALGTLAHRRPKSGANPSAEGPT
jgi:Bacterial membrane protein YfhO